MDPASNEVQPDAVPQDPSDSLLKSPEPRTVGGFIMDSSSDDGGITTSAAEAAQSNASESNVANHSSNTPQPFNPPFARPSSSHSGCISETHENITQSHQDSSNRGVLGDQEKQTFSQNMLGSSLNGNSDIHHKSTGSGHSSKTATPSAEIEAAYHDPSPLNQTSESAPKSRDPNDRLGILEDRIEEDPRGDLDAWLALISEYKDRADRSEIRRTYDRLLAVFPNAAEQIADYANFEIDDNNWSRAEAIFNTYLPKVPHMNLWTVYLHYVRRRFNLADDRSGQSRQIVSDTFNSVLDAVGLDVDSGPLWDEYIKFMESSPGKMGNDNWQDQQKMDSVRKAYERAVALPQSSITDTWKNYETFEKAVNKQASQRELQTKSTDYVPARKGLIQVKEITAELNMSTLPPLPPAEGFEGYFEYEKQVRIWQRWIQWEKNDPLSLKAQHLEAYKKRVVFLYKQAIMRLRFWPEIWFDAAYFCFSNKLNSEGSLFLEQGYSANPESCLLAFAHADRIESNTQKVPARERANLIREPLDKVIQALRGLWMADVEREKRELQRIEAEYPSSEPLEAPGQQALSDPPRITGEKESRIRNLQEQNRPMRDVLCRAYTHAWIALMRAWRRVLGKGNTKANEPGYRTINVEARRDSRMITPELWVAGGLIEWNCYDETAANTTFKTMARLFPHDEYAQLEHVKYLLSKKDAVNARAAFETATQRFAQSPSTLHKAKPLFAILLDYESQFGDLPQIERLESRMRELFPEDSRLQIMASRYNSVTFDIRRTQPVVSPGAQMRPRTEAMQDSLGRNNDASNHRALLSSANHMNSSPKRRLDESDDEQSAARKYQRSDSPLKGAAGRRVNATKRAQHAQDMQTNGGMSTPPTTQYGLSQQAQAQALAQQPQPGSLQQWTRWFISQLPKYGTYQGPSFDLAKSIGTMQQVDLDKADAQAFTKSQQEYQAHIPRPASSQHASTPQLGYALQTSAASNAPFGYNSPQPAVAPFYPQQPPSTAQYGLGQPPGSVYSSGGGFR